MATLLLAIWAGVCAIDDIGTQMIRRPLLIATVVGIILGDIPTALLIGATLEIMWMGVGNVGAYSAPDMISGTVIATALGIISGGGTATAVAVAVPTFLAIHFGSDFITLVVEALPEVVIKGLGVAGKIIPAVGIALLMQMMIKKAELWVFILAAFALSVYLNLSVLPITLIALPVALLYDLATNQKSAPAEKAVVADEEDYDL